MALTRRGGAFGDGYKPSGTTPSPNLETPIATGPIWPKGVDAQTMVRLCEFLITRLEPLVVVPGDVPAACIESLRSFRSAIRDNWKHGQNWLGKHGGDLAPRLRICLPDIFPVPPAEKELEGSDLLACCRRVFPAARLLRLGTTAKDLIPGLGREDLAQFNASVLGARQVDDTEVSRMEPVGSGQRELAA
jgi:hypothetical protein